MDGQRPKRYWIIVKYGSSPIEALLTNLTAREKALAVFSFEEEARMFLQYRALKGRWKVRETTAGELISILLGPCALVERVALDPLPGMDVGALAYLVSMRREDFVEFLASEQKLRLCTGELGATYKTPTAV